MIDDLYEKILNYIEIETSVKYIQGIHNDGEQMRTIFYKNYYPFNLVCKKWKKYYI